MPVRIDDQPPTAITKPKWLNPIVALFPIGWLVHWIRNKLFPQYHPMATVILPKGYYFEGPRIHNGHLYVSDMHQKQVLVIDVFQGNIIETIRFDDRVSGLGFTPQGQLLIVSMFDRQLLGYDCKRRTTTVLAKLSPYTAERCNEMVVDVTGRAYVGNFGFDIDRLQDACTTTLVAVSPDSAEASIAARDIFFPNGTVFVLVFIFLAFIWGEFKEV